MSSEKDSKAKQGGRKYTQKERARQQDETRLKITQAVVDLHKKVGPAYTTVSDVASRAGVGRMTVYKHFPTDVDLFAACSAHWSESYPLPDFSDCAGIEDLEARCSAVLVRLYKYYAGGHDMLGKIMRDAPSMPALQEVLAQNWEPGMAQLESLLLPSGLGASTKKNVRAVIRLVLDLTNWETLVAAGLSDTRAARLGARLIVAAAQSE